MSKKINNYILFDWETGGFDCKKNPVIEFAAIVLRGTDYEQLLSYDNIIRPYDEKLVYEPEAEKVHGISKERAQQEGIQLSQFLEDFKQICQEANPTNSKISKPVLVGHNPGFDIPFLQDVAERGKLDLSKLLSGYFDNKGNFQPAYIDTLQTDKNSKGATPDDSIKFNLTECCRREGIEVIDAHRAMNDVIPTKQLFIELMSRTRGKSSTHSGETGVSRFRKKFRL